MNTIEVEALSLWYGNFQALKNVFLSSTGGITSLIGPSGCGKTTLLRCLNRMAERASSVRSEGSVRLLGKNIYDPDVSLLELRRSVGMVFQRPNPLPLSIYENVVFGLRLHDSLSKKRSEQNDVVEQSLRSVELWDRVKDKLHTPATDLQLEEQQKLCIARLLPVKPEIILMDEPCSALDVNGTAAIETLMRKDFGPHTILIVTHNMAQARRVSDHCAFMLNGELIEHGTTAALFEDAQDERTVNYLKGRFG